MNNITLTGNLTKDPIIERTSNEKIVAKGTIAVNRPYNKDLVDYFDFDIWESQAEYYSKYAHKGDKVEIVGIMENQRYESKDGTLVSKWRVKVNSIAIFAKAQVNDQKAKSKVAEDDDLHEDMPF